MTHLLSSREPLLREYDAMLPMLEALSPNEFKDLRSNGLSKFKGLGLPTRHDEEFKFISFRALEEEKFEPAYGATIDRADVLAASVVGDFQAVTFAFINGQFAPELSHLPELPKGVSVTSFEEAELYDGNALPRYLGKIANLTGMLGSTNDERFVHLNTAFLAEGVVVHIAKGVEFPTPIHILHVNHADRGAFASYPRALIVLEENACAQVLESHIGLQGRYFSDAVTEVFLGPSARLVHTKLQDESSEAIHVGNVSVKQQDHSNYLSFNVNFGASISRNDLNVYSAGEHTETRLDGVTVGQGDQVIDNHTRIDHTKPNCNSFEVYKTVLRDSAHGIFNGKIFVYEDAQKTDAKQTNQTILMSPKASMDTKPQLEIFADDVKCTHGATIGQMNDEALFYLRSRGIGRNEAQAILVYAFAAEVLERIPNDDLKKRLESRLYSSLSVSKKE